MRSWRDSFLEPNLPFPWVTVVAARQDARDSSLQLSHFGMSALAVIGGLVFGVPARLLGFPVVFEFLTYLVVLTPCACSGRSAPDHPADAGQGIRRLSARRAESLGARRRVESSCVSRYVPLGPGRIRRRYSRVDGLAAASVHVGIRLAAGHRDVTTAT